LGPASREETSKVDQYEAWSMGWYGSAASGIPESSASAGASPTGDVSDMFESL